MKLSSAIPLLLSIVTPTVTHAFAPQPQSSSIHTAFTSSAQSSVHGPSSVMPLNMVASQEVEVINRRKKTKEVRRLQSLTMIHYYYCDYHYHYHDHSLPRNRNV
jgi:hypothetical protein